MALLRYQILFNQGLQFNSSLAGTQSDVLPVLLGGGESTDCVVESLIGGLQQGTTYILKVQAIAPIDMLGEQASVAAVATTYGSGEAPCTPTYLTHLPTLLPTLHTHLPTLHTHLQSLE